MTTPTEGSDPAVPVPPSPEPTPEEAAAQQAAAEAAAAEAAFNDKVRALAAEIAKQTILEYDPVTRRKGTVTSLQTGSAPPTITVTISGDTTVEIPGVRYYEHYQPKVSDVVHIDKQGTDIVAVGKIAEQVSETGFTAVPLINGFTNNGNGNGNLMVRRIWDNGQWKVEFQGGINCPGGQTVLCNALDAKYRPTSATRRTVLCARDAAGSNVVKVDVGNDGSLSLVGTTTAGVTTDLGDTGSTTPNDSAHEHTGTTNVVTPNDSSHTHASHTHNSGASNAGLSSHSHSGTTTVVSGHEHGIPNSDHQHPTHDHGISSEVNPTSTHNHGGHEHVIFASSHNHGGHAHDQGSHNHAATEPVWVSFNQVEYYL